MSDDHTAQAIGAYATLSERSQSRRPRSIRLAAEGICFDNAFCTNAICTPSRACIITGQYNHINGVFDLGGKIEPPNQTLPIVMRKAGYQTAMIGKWHLKVEPNFDYYKVLPGQGKVLRYRVSHPGRQAVAQQYRRSIPVRTPPT